MLILDFEDYVQPADLQKGLEQAGLWDRVYVPNLTKPLPTLLDVTSPPAEQRENKRRLIVTSENHAGQAPWLVGSYQLMQESPYTFTKIEQFNCKPNRGGPTNPMVLVNHWLRPNGPPDPVAAAKVNSQATLTDRLEQCIDVRGRLPNVLAVDFVGIGDLTKTVNYFNSAVAVATGTTAFWDQAIEDVQNDTSLSTQDRADAENLPRLPFVTAEQSLGLLGAPLSDKLETPELVKLLQQMNDLASITDEPIPKPTVTPGKPS